MMTGCLSFLRVRVCAIPDAALMASLAFYHATVSYKAFLMFLVRGSPPGRLWLDAYIRSS